MNLHYSQTKVLQKLTRLLFVYHMNLHYSQTYLAHRILIDEFVYHMNLHYSQTDSYGKGWDQAVCLPYEFTLLSNAECGHKLVG